MIESHEFQDDRVKLTAHSDEYLYFNCEGGLAFFTKSDIEVMAKAVNVPNECMELRAEIAILNQRLLNKKVN
jgi:hypothetical protein